MITDPVWSRAGKLIKLRILITGVYSGEGLMLAT